MKNIFIKTQVFAFLLVAFNPFAEAGHSAKVTESHSMGYYMLNIDGLKVDSNLESKLGTTGTYSCRTAGHNVISTDSVNMLRIYCNFRNAETGVLASSPFQITTEKIAITPQMIAEAKRRAVARAMLSGEIDNQPFEEVMNSATITLLRCEIVANQEISNNPVGALSVYCSSSVEFR